MAGLIRLTWRDRNQALEEDGHRIYRSQSPMDIENLPEPIADLGNGVTTYDDAAVVEGETYHYIISAYRGDEEKYSEEHIAFAKSIDLGIGEVSLIGGDLSAGFFGEVESSELFTGDELASMIGFSSSDGNRINSSSPWLKFIIDGEIIYIAKKPYRSSISWMDINAVNAVYNDENAPIVEKDGYQFRVTLMTGAEADPTVDENGEGSEWNRLMYRIHKDDPSGDPWVEYSDDDIVVGDGGGRTTWVQERKGSFDRVTRGTGGIEHFGIVDRDHSTRWRGWRPVLRLISK